MIGLTQTPAKWPDFRDAIAFDILNRPKEFLAASLEPRRDDFSSNDYSLKAKIGWTIPQEKSTFDKFSKVGWIGIKHTGTRFLPCQVPPFRQ